MKDYKNLQSIEKDLLSIPQLIAPKDVSAIDVSSIKAYQMCPMQYYYRYICGLVRERLNPATTYGGAFHKAWNIMYQQMKHGQAPEKKTIIGEFVKAYPSDLDETRTIANGSLILDQYIDKFFEEPFEVIATESGFCIDLGAFDFIGRMDGVIKWLDRILVLENKTSMRPSAVLKEFEYGIQSIGYAFAAHMLGYDDCQGVLLNVTAVNMPKTEGAMKRWETERFTRKIVTVDERQEAQFYYLLNKTIEDVWNERFFPNLTGCSLYGECEYSSICKHGWELTKDFYQVEEWNPLSESEPLEGGI